VLGASLHPSSLRSSARQFPPSSSSGASFERGLIQEYAKSNITESEQGLFLKFVEQELNDLHEGVLARYLLNKEDFDKWQNRAKA
jgi:hypothetical protein